MSDGSAYGEERAKAEVCGPCTSGIVREEARSCASRSREAGRSAAAQCGFDNDNVDSKPMPLQAALFAAPWLEYPKNPLALPLPPTRNLG